MSTPCIIRSPVNLKLTIQINKPPEEVFAFTLNPENTPKWLNSIVVEKTSCWPPGKGTVYKNKDRAGKWNEYLVSKFQKNKTKLEYFEWVKKGELKEPFKQEFLEKLKTVIEKE